MATFWTNRGGQVVKEPSNRKMAHRFNLFFLTTALVPVFSIGLFNAAIDPYGIIGSPTFYGINQAKSQEVSHDRLLKAIEVIREKPTVIFLGPSTAQFGLDPRSLNLENQIVYNVALQNASVYELKRYLQHAIANQKNLKTVVLGLDLLMFKPDKKINPTFSEERLEKQTITMMDFLDTVFSFNAFNASYETLMNNIKNPQPEVQYINGTLFFDQSKPMPGSLKRFTSFLSRKSGKPNSNDKKISKEILDNLKEIVDFCQKKGLELKIFISPSHVSHLEGFRIAGRWLTFEQWKRELVKITPVWDFSGYNSITTEPISNNMKYYYDSLHYSPSAGALVINKLFDNSQKTVPADFGTLINPSNVESQLRKIRADREVWAKQHPDVVKLVQNISTDKKLKNGREP